MRTLLTGELTTALSASARHYLKVEIQDADGTWQDWSSRVTGSGGFGEERDTPVASATVRVHRGLSTSSLAPLLEASTLNEDALGAYAPALEIGRGMRISTATLTSGSPVSGDYREMFTGRVNRIDDGDGDVLVLHCSDTGAWLMDTQIRDAAEYGSDLGTAIETVIQDIVDDTPSEKVTPTLYTPASPSYLVTTFTLEPAKVLEAARDVALRIGYDLRYRYDASHVSRLTFMDPDRDRATVDTTIGPSQYLAIRALTLDLAAIRNRGRLLYRDSTGAQQSVTYEDATSVADYGDRWFQIPEQEGIDTETEAQTMLDAIGHDLSGPGAEQVVTMRYFWPAQLYDRYTFSANGVHYDTDQTVSVGAVRHEWDSTGEIRTTLTGTTRVVGAYAAWRRRLRQGEDETPTGPTLDVQATPGATTYSIAWSGSGGVVEVAIDGGAYASAPTSPIAVARPSAGSVPKTYTFRVVGTDQTVTNEVSIPAVDQDTVTPDLTVTPGNPLATTQDFTVTASNPSGGAAPTVTVYLRGTNATLAGFGTLHADTEWTLTSGDTIVVNRPAFGTATQASVTFKASLSGAGAETIQRTIQNQVKTTFGPSLEVTPTPGASTYSLAYTGSGGTVELSIDGAAFASAPASPIAVTRPTAGSPSKSYAFRIVADGQTIANEVTIPAIDKDTNTVTPDLTVAPSTPTTTTQDFTVTATDPSGSATPTVYITIRGTTGFISGFGTLHDGAEFAVPNGSVLTVNRPAFGTTTQASVTFRAALAGGGQEIIQRSIQNQVKDSFGPTLDVTPTPGSSSYSIAYTYTGTVTLSIDGGSYSAPAASPIVVSRGTADKTYTFKAVLDGQTITQAVVIPAAAGTTTRFISNVQVTGVDNFSNEITVAWSAATNTESGDVYDLVWVRGNSVASGEVLGVTSPYDHASGGSGGHGLDLTNGGTVEPMHYVVRVRNSGGSVVGQSGQISYDVDHT